MSRESIQNTYFTTCTISNWTPIFYDMPECNQFVIDSLDYLHKNNKVKIYAFVIMKHHLHLVWEMLDGISINNSRSALLKNTGYNFRKYLLIKDPLYLENFESNRNDREYHFWKSNHRSFEIYNYKILWQKINYTHNNPENDPTLNTMNKNEYYYSSAKYYESGVKDFDFLRKPS